MDRAPASDGPAPATAGREIESIEISDETLHSRPPRESHGDPLRVLVVEDNPDNAQGLAALVELWGHEVRIARDGESALEIFERFAPRVVVADIGLPRLDGYELARRLRRLDAGAPRCCVLIALTGYGQPRDRRLAFEVGFDHHLTKPVDPTRMEELLAECRRRFSGTGEAG